jgi:hypothetical protein
MTTGGARTLATGPNFSGIPIASIGMFLVRVDVPGLRLRRDG